jgi:hypothetical protein
MRPHLFIFFAITCSLTAACGRQHQPALASYSPLAEVETTYGRLITAGNHPTPYQSGTGERIGLFEDANGVIWGLPLIVADHGAILVCAPPALREEAVTDHVLKDSIVIGSANEPTGWRGGTGGLELLLRDPNGTPHWQAVSGARLSSGMVCQTGHPSVVAHQLHYYRLARAVSATQ